LDLVQLSLSNIADLLRVHVNGIELLTLAKGLALLALAVLILRVLTLDLGVNLGILTVLSLTIELLVANRLHELEVIY
jgi:hypothetical protein